MQLHRGHVRLSGDGAHALSSISLAKTPTAITKGGNAATILRASAGEMKRGEGGKKLNPSADAPNSTASCASSSRVMPHIFTRVGMANRGWQAGALAALASIAVPALRPGSSATTNCRR